MIKKSVNIFDNLKGTRIMLYGVILSLIIATLSFGFITKSTKESLLEKTNQINALVQEVGELKEENLYLYDYLKINRDIVSEGFDLLHKSFEDYVISGVSEKKDVENQLKKVKTDLITAIGEKEKIIENLKVKNEKLNNEMSFQTYENDITNILILGTHDDLTDTIILASINPSKRTITLISIPRDLYLNGRKINSIYSVFGIDRVKEDIYKVTGVYVHKYAIIDFDSFINMIDIIGGIDLYVKNDIYDPYFPDTVNGYEVYEIKAGSYHFSGAEALMYARSRKSTSDFDRSTRQHEVIQAVRVKLKRLDLLGDLDKAIDLFSEIAASFKTDIDVFEALYYLNHYQNYAIESGNILSTSNLLYSTESFDGQYILLPKNGDYYEIKKQISELIKN
jgi:LCP family protein required for cell wall assembly